MLSVQAASLFSWRAWMNVMQVLTPISSSCHLGLRGEHQGYCAEGHTCQKAGNQRAWGNVGGFAAREIRPLCFTVISWFNQHAFHIRGSGWLSLQ